MPTLIISGLRSDIVRVVYLLFDSKPARSYQCLDSRAACGVCGDLVRRTFYLPRIFVYYAQAEDDTTKTTLAVMARKLYKFVTPLMMLAVALACGGSVLRSITI